MEPHMQELFDFFSQEDSSFLNTLASLETVSDGCVHHEPKPHVQPSAHVSKNVIRRDAVDKPLPKPVVAPWFNYKDYSMMADPNPNVPVTAPGRIPNFPAKMYAILSRNDLKEIVSWMDHGRSWKVHKPREFEVKVIPMYFEHSKFSSFIRQANGWGFRRMISKGPDRNSYYHEMFLRSCPHLMKLMKRPAPSSKPVADASTEPDFYRISEEAPLPEMKASGDLKRSFAEDEQNILAHCNLIDRSGSTPNYQEGSQVSRKMARTSMNHTSPTSQPAPVTSSCAPVHTPSMVDNTIAPIVVPSCHVQPVVHQPRQCTCNCSASRAQPQPVMTSSCGIESMTMHPLELSDPTDKELLEDVFIDGYKPGDESFWLL